MKLINRFIVLCSVLGMASVASASSHREAPGIAEDPYADNTDTYAFISPEDPNSVVLIANYVPLLAPAYGPNFARFSDNVLYEIRIDNSGDAVADISYEFRFRTTVRNGATFLYNTGAVTSPTDTTLNVQQTYTVTRRNLATGAGTAIVTDQPAAPWDVGRRSFADYTAVANMAINASNGRKVFAGPRHESFQVDFNVFDLLGLGPRVSSATMGGPAYPGGNLRPNYATNYNVMSLAVQVPITEVAAGGVRPANSNGVTGVIGVYATASRRQVSILRRSASRPRVETQGQWVQVSRLGLPLVNEVLIPLSNKDNYNRTLPANDATNYGATILRPELNGLLVGVIPELGCTMQPAGTMNATILAIITANGTTAADLLRLKIGTGETFAQSAFPNGRKIADDVFTAEVNVICAANLAMPSPTAPLGPNVIGGPVATDIAATFPYLGAPIRPD